MHFCLPSCVRSNSGILFTDVLPRVWRFVQLYEPSVQYIFLEQLAEIVRGRVAQDPALRLAQFYVPHMDERDPLFQLLRVSPGKVLRGELRATLVRLNFLSQPSRHPPSRWYDYGADEEACPI